MADGCTIGAGAKLAYQIRDRCLVADFLEEPMPQVWRYCPNCFALADSSSLLKRCAKCPTSPNNRLTVLPIDPDAAQAAIRIGGVPALVTMIVAVVGGPAADDELEKQSKIKHFADCAVNHSAGLCDMNCGSWPAHVKR